MPTSTLVRALGPAGPASDAADLTYTPSVLTDWDSDTDPGNADGALDQLAERVDDNEILIAAHGPSQHTTGTAWRLTYLNAAGEETEIVLGADGTFLESNGASAAPAFRALAVGDVPFDDATSDPLIDGAAAADGTEGSPARKDHVHPRHHAKYIDAEAVSAVEAADPLDLANALQVDIINEHTGAAGVTIDGVLLKDSTVSTGTGLGMKLSIWGTTWGLGIQSGVFEFIASRGPDGDYRWGYGTSGSLTEVMFLDAGLAALKIDTIAELTGAAGVTIDGVLLKDGKLELNATAILDGATAGQITTTGNIVPSVDSADDLGSSAEFFANAYVDKINLGSTAAIDSSLEYVAALPDVPFQTGAKGNALFTGTLTIDVGDTNQKALRLFGDWTSSGAPPIFGIYDTSDAGNPDELFAIYRAGSASQFAVMRLNTSTVAGNIADHWIPLADSTYILGGAALYWYATYTDRLYLNATALLEGATAGHLLFTGDLVPATDDTEWIGQLEDPFKAIKGLVIKDTTDGKHYKLEVISGTITATALD